jgi:flagellar P-ring protein precursor FlgI
MRKLWLIMLLVVCTALAQGSQLRIKDLARVEGVDENPLTGIGLVVGLSGTGDSRSTVFTNQMLANTLSSHGLDAEGQIRSRNVAAVTITASLPPFAKPGDKIDLVISSVGDARSLAGGVLLASELLAADGQRTALGQGSVLVGGYSAGARGSSVSKNHLTAGRVPGGGTVIRSLENPLPADAPLRFILNESDFTTAVRIADCINSVWPGIAEPVDGQTVECTLPDRLAGQSVAFISQAEQLPVVPDQAAKVVVDERTGAIVIGGNVVIGEAAVAHGGITVRISSKAIVSQPPSFSRGDTVVGEQSDLQLEENQGPLVYLPATASVEELVSALNQVGAGPRELISILQALKAAGALWGELIVL